MDLLGYAVVGGLERIAIVVGAVVIGYWGYRLYAGEKNAGLVFMGLAVVILGGALATGASQDQLATMPEPAAKTTTPEATPAPGVPQTAPVGVDPAAAVSVPEPAQPAPIRTPPTGGADTAAAPVTEHLDESAVGAVDDVPVGVVAEVSSPARIATGQELGGRIVSIKSENVSLEWSNDSD